MKPVLEDELVRLADIATVEFDGYIRDLIAERRRDPGDDLLSALIAAEEEGDRLTENELANLLFTIMAAGNETTTSLISTGTKLLLENPDEHKKLAADPSLIGNAVEEMLRYEAPIQNAFMRIADRDTTLMGDEVVEGEMVAALIGAANHDPAVFPDPDRFVVDRPGAENHLSFGGGIHFCLGRRDRPAERHAGPQFPPAPLPRPQDRRNAVMAEDDPHPPPRPPRRRGRVSRRVSSPGRR